MTVTASGLDAQLGIAQESTFGTRAAASRFYEFISETVKAPIDRIDSKGIRAGRKTLHRRHAAATRAVGGWTMELSPQGLGLLQRHLFGVDTITGTNPYVHTSTPTLLDGLSFTLQIGRPSLDGVVRPFEYTGCKVTDWQLDAKVGEIATLGVNIYGVAEDTGQTLATASYPTGLSPFVFTHGSLTSAAAAVDLMDISLKGNNGLAVDRHRISATTPSKSKEPKENALREYGGTMTADFNDLTQYNHFVAADQLALVLTFNAGASAQLVITQNVMFDGETPNVSGRQLLTNVLPFKSLHATADGSTITWATTNADVAA